MDYWLLNLGEIMVVAKSGLLFHVFLFSLLVGAMPCTSAVISQGSIPIFAVTDSGEALKAVLSIEIESGTGKIWSSVGPLIGTSTQNTEKIAIKVARDYFENIDKYDYKFDINSNASIVEGPSAGAAMALLLVSMLQDKHLPEYVAVTGTINEDGTVGSVGGVFEKAQKAAEAGVKLFMIPVGDAIQMHKFEDGVRTVNLVEYALKEWSLKVVEVDNVDEMLQYAFSDLNSIDVNKEAQSQPLVFEPPKIPLSPKLEEMKPLAERYLKAAEDEIDKAKKALELSDIKDEYIIQTLFGFLTPAEKNLEKASILLEKNYLYSSANYSFTSYVSAKVVEDISNNPSLLTLDSSLLGEKAIDLKNEIAELESELDLVTYEEKAEWQIGAMERVSWAKINIEKVLANRVLPVDSSEELVAAVKNVEDYEYAAAWVSIAKDFLEIAKKAKTRSNPYNGLRETAMDYLIKAEDAMSVLPDEKQVDIKRRIDAAKVEKAKQWFAASAFDSASAFALAVSEKYTEGKTLNELQSALSSKISNIKSAMKKSGREFLWAKLYLDHAEYFLKESRYYEEKGKKVKATQSASDGISLAFMATEVFNVSDKALSEIEQGNIVVVTITPSPESNAVVSPTPAAFNFVFVIKSAMPFVLILLICIIAVLIFLYQKHGLVVIEPAAQKRASEVEKMKKKLDRAFERNKISGKEYRELSKQYDEEIKAISEEQRKKSRHLIQMDILQGELKLLQYAIKKLQRQYAHGEILEEDYKKTMKLLTSRMEKTKEELLEEEEKKKVSKPKFGKPVPRRKLSRKRKAQKVIEKRLSSAQKKQKTSK